MTLPPLEGQGIGGSVSGGFAVGVASLVVRQSNVYRKKLTFVNDSVNIMYGAKGDIALINAGVRLNANGGTWVIEPDTRGRIWTGAVSFIATAAASNICFTEDW